jgi:4-amino-4-deoxy-L-arabinose transferase-like glycosyltransferase
MIGEQILPRFQTTLKLRSLMIVVGVVIVLAFVLINLDAYPATWFDEGQFLHVPKALVQHGVYADWSSEGPRFYGPTVAAGPTLLLPIAAVFRVAGAGLLQARLVMGLYLIVCLVLVYVVTARIYSDRVALLATALLLSSRGAATLLWGRQVLGEIPALVFVLAGLLFWQGALQHRCGRRALMAGVCWGLAMVTKNQVTLALTPAIGLLALLDWRYYRNGRWSLRVLPLAVAVALAGAWLLALFALLGPGNLAENLALTGRATSGAIIVLSPDAVGRALWFLLSPRLYGGLVLPALAYAVWRVWRRRDLTAQGESGVIVITAVWLVWYTCSLGWPRYAYIGAALGALPVASMLITAFDVARQRQRTWIAVGLAIVATLLVVVPLAQTANEMLRPDRSVLRFAAYLDRTVQSEAIIETWEPELGALTDHRYHYPSQALLDVAVRHQWRGGPPARYDLEHLQAPYVVVGPFGAWTGVYPADQLQQLYQPIYHEGPYVLYRRLP